MSILTFPLGFGEYLVVPAYWIPPSLFNLAQTTRIDIESFIFSFAVGGISACLYDVFCNKYLQTTPLFVNSKRLAYVGTIVVVTFLLLFFGIKWNAMLAFSTAVGVSALIRILYRPELAIRTICGGALFVAFYIISLSFLLGFYPHFIQDTWNLSHLSGIILLNIPLEEYLFAASQGLFWSGIYEEMACGKVKVKSLNANHKCR